MNKLSNLLSNIDDWSTAIDNAFLLAIASQPIATALNKEANIDDSYSLHYAPLLDKAYISFADDYLRQKIAKVVPLTDTKDPSTYWIRIKVGGFGMADVTGWGEKNPVTKVLGGPSTFTATLGTGLLGAGAGYLTGSAIENLAPKDANGQPMFAKNKLRNTLGLGGLAAGASVPLWAGYRGWFDKPPTELPTANLKQANEFLSSFIDHKTGYLIELEKAADIEAGGADFMPSIPVDSFNRAVLQDPYTPIPIRTATLGLVGGAGAIRQTPFVSPSDITRIAMGMGSGYASGLIVGKALGALAGLSEPTQQSLQQAGVWAGILKNTIPLAFGN